MATAVKSAPRPSPMIGRLAGREAAREACPTDSITSSYGVGPTDDRGRPLFGLKALRRTNTNRTLEPEPASGTTTKQTSTSTSTYTSSSSTANTSSSRPRAADITDSSGLPLFGGLRALKISSTNSSATASEQNGASGPGSPPLRDLVQRHEQHARESSATPPAQQLTQRPRAKLRDSFVQDDEAPVLERAESFRSTTSIQLSPCNAGDSPKFSFEKSEKSGGSRVDEESLEVSRKKLSDDSRSSSSSSPPPSSSGLKSLIGKHEIISSSGDSLLDSSRRGILKKPRDEGVTTSTSSFSRSTVVSQRQVVGPDGTVSLTRDVIRGETVSKPGQEPVTNVSREHFAYETPEPSALSITQLDSEDEEVRRSGSRKSSPSPDRVLIESAQSSKRSSRNFEEDTKFSSSFRRSSAQDDFIQTEKAHSTLASQNGDEVDDRGSRSYSSKVTRDNPNKWSNTVSTKKTDGNATTHTTTTTSKERRASGGVTSESTSVSSKSVTTTKSSSPSRKSPTREVSSKKQTNDKSSTGSSSESKSTSRFTSSSRTSTSRNSSSSNIERRRSSATADDASEEGSSTVTSSLLRTSQRGSVRALQEKFQKAAADANSADTARSNRSYPKAGLIFRSASFRSSSGDGTAPVTPSSPNTPSTPLSDLGTNPTLKQSASMEVRVGSPVASPLPSTPSSSETRSFLNDRTAVTDVHDVLTRMRNADIVVESGDSAEDQAARSLLNKFLGASVILQGMEPLVSDRHTSSSTSSASARQTIVTGGAPASTTSAALVSQVERQRLSGAKVTNGSASDPTADLDSIWDEAHLRSLLDVCSDYEGRRKIRARLRTVMAEQKACEGVVAAAQRSATDESRSVDGDTSSASSVHGKSELFKSSTSTDGSSTTHTEVRTKTSHFTSTSSMASNKGGPPKPISPFAKFQQLDRQSSSASAPRISK